jgi:hypothetical protein
VRARLVLLISVGLIACGIDQQGEADKASGGAAGSSIGVGAAGAGASAFGGGGAAASGDAATTGGNGGSGGTLDASAGGAAGAATGGGAGMAGGGGVVSGTVEYVAKVADCVGTTGSNPDTCAAVYGELHVDVSADLLGGQTSIVYLRFEPDNQLAGASSISAELVLGNVNGSDQSGEVHTVAPFQRSDLFAQAPSLGALTAGNLGAVSVGQSVVWQLDSAPAANQPFCVALSTTTNDGIGYATLSSTAPPTLRVTFSK